MKHVYITVKLDLADEADIDEVVQEMFYNFEYGNDILGTEIMGIERVNYSGPVLKS